MNPEELITQTLKGIDKDKELNNEEKRVLKMIAEESIRSGFKRGVGEKSLKTKKEVIEHLFSLRYTKYFKTQQDTFWRIQRNARVKFSGETDVEVSETDVRPEDPATDDTIVSKYDKCKKCGIVGFVGARNNLCTQCQVGGK